MTKAKKKPKLGRACIRGYVVDMNDLKMVELAIEALHDDVKEAVIRKPEELSEMTRVTRDPTALARDIPDFLKEDCDVEED